MTATGGIRRLMLIAVTVGAVMTGQARAEVSCHRINARGVGQDLGGGATEAQIVGGGLLHGTTAALFTITSVSGTLATFEGTVTFTTAHGTLSVSVIGNFDIATGEFSASGPVTDATGKLEGATGNVSLEGLQNLITGTFEEDITGAICVDLSPR